jgi:signal transduction histidine kinase
MAVSGGSSPKILVTGGVGLRGYLCELLRQQGYQPLEAATAAQALKVLSQGQADLALLDRSFVGSLEGIGMLEAARRCQLPMVILEEPGKCPLAHNSRHGLVKYLPKPLKAQELLAAVQSLLAGTKRYAVPSGVDDTRLMYKLQHQTMTHLVDAIAHDLEDLLSTLTGCCTLVVNQTGDQGAAPLRTDVGSTGERTGTLLRQVVVSWHQQLASAHLLDLNLVVQNLWGLIRRLLGGEIAFSLELAPGPCLVRAAPEQLEQVILHLAVQARDALPDGGRCTLAVRPAAGHQAADSAAAPGEPVRLSLHYPAPAASSGGRPRPQATPLGGAERETSFPKAGLTRMVKQCGGQLQVDRGGSQGTTLILALPRAEVWAVPADDMPWW